MRPGRCWRVLVAALLLAGSAPAHLPSVSWLELGGSAGRVEVRWTLPLPDLEEWLGIDADRDGAITWGELESASLLLGSLANEVLGVSGRRGPIGLRLEKLMVDDLAEGPAAVLCLAGELPEGPERGTGSPDPGDSSELGIELLPGAVLSPLHRAFLRVRGKAGKAPPPPWVLTRDRPRWSGTVGPPGW